MLKLYDFLPSGNDYKVRLLLTQMNIPFERVNVDITKGESRTVDYLAKNPNGRVPLLELEDGRCLPESNAIMFYLAEESDFFPTDRFEQVQVLQWLFFEQYSHEPYIATSRYIISILGKADDYQDVLAEKREKGYAALKVMEQHLSDRPFFVAGRYTIADIGLYAYTHVAHEGGFDLSGFSQIRLWLDRVQAQPNHIPITQAC
ncbi:MAG: glutathione S-transferase family protein [Cyanobacteria bacterium P01_E01_bin.6]